VVPQSFGFISSEPFELNGEKHEQSVYFDKDKKEAILFSPAHGDYPDITTVLTSKNGNQKAKSLMCDDQVCHLNEVNDKLHLDPQLIAEVYEKRASGENLEIDTTKTITQYVIRSDHKFLDQNELEHLPESMKNVGNGKTILSSSTTVQLEMPNMNLSLSDHGKRSSGSEEEEDSCQPRYFCGSPNKCGCSWSFQKVDKSDVYDDDGKFVVHTVHTVHNVVIDEFCIHCCLNSKYYPYNNYVLCDDFTKPTIEWMRNRAFSTAVAVTFYNQLGKDKVQCPGSFPKFMPNCRYYGNRWKVGRDGNGELKGIGQCVKKSKNTCLKERSKPLTWN